MKFSAAILPLAVLSTAIVIPDDVMSQHLLAENERIATTPKSIFEKLPSTDEIVESAKHVFDQAVEITGNAFDNAVDATYGIVEESKSKFECYKSMMAFDTKEWLDSAMSTAQDIDFDIFEHGEHPHHPKHPPHHKKPHHGHGGRHGPPNMTVYELINSSKYTTKLAKLINKYDNLVEALNGTSHNFTVFAPTDKAFEKIPKHHHNISESTLYQILAYHVSPDFYPAGRVLVTHTIPTLKEEEGLGGEPQRLRVGLGLKGLAVNFYSRIVAINIFGTNGVIHGVDSLLLPPPPSTKIIELLPGEFSTLQLALEKTGLFDAIKKAPHAGGTLFAPSNWAFKKLGPRINAFLFSKYGEKYLKALLEYHVVANQTLYSDAFYSHTGSAEVDVDSIPKGYFHVDLPTLLHGKSLSIDIARYGGLIDIKINGFSRVSTQDGIAKDGVVHVLSSVLIPPKTPGGDAEALHEDISVEELKERLSAHMPEPEL